MDRSPEELVRISNEIYDMFAPKEDTMKAEPWIYGLAKQMLGKDALSQEDKCGIQLRDYLEDIETFANLVNGSIQSRQVVALALVHYLDRKTLMRKIAQMEKDIDRLKGLED